MKLRKFKRGDNFFFQMLNDAGDIILESQSYTSKDARDNGVESVKTNIGNPDRYDTITEGGQNYFILKAGNNQEIARSIGYADTGAMQTAMSYAQGGSDGGEAYGTDGKSDDYKPLSFYESRSGGVDTGFAKFEAEGEWYFSYLLDGSVYLISEGYKSEAARDNGIASVEKNMPNRDRYQTQQHPNGKYFFNLRAGNNQEIATSRWFDGDGERDGIIARLTGTGGGTGTAATGDMVAANRVANVGIAAPPPPAAPKEKKPRKKRTTPKKPKAEKVYLSNGNYHFNEVSYDVFRSGNGKHYFTFKNKDGKTILLNSNVRGFDTQEQADNMVGEVLKYGPIESNYEGKMTSNGKYYFYLNGEEGKHIAKSFFFGTEEEMQVTIGSLLGDARAAAAAAPQAAAAPAPAPAAETAAAPAKKEKKDDDYLACKVYKSHVGSKHPDHSDFIVFTEGDEHYFAWVDGDDIVMRSEGYTTEKARENGIQSVIKNRGIEARWTSEEKMGYHFAILKAGNHQEIARSCPEKDKGRALWWFPGAIAKREEEAKAAAAAKAKAEEEAKAAKAKAEKEATAAKAKAAAVPTAAKKSDKEQDDYLHCSYYEGKPRSEKYNDFSTFERDGEFYFALLDNKGDVVLRSEGYKSEKGRENGIQSVIKNMEIEKRWSVEENRGVYFNILKAGNHQEIGRSCPLKAKPSGTFRWGYWATGATAAAGVAASTQKVAASAPVPSAPKEKEDDYLACKEYEGRKVNDKQNNVALFKHEGDGQYYFALYNENGDVKLRSEGFKTAKQRDEELSGVLKYHDNKDMYKRITRGKYYMDVLYDKTGREVGRSCLKTVKAAAAAPIKKAAAVAAAATAVAAKPAPKKVEVKETKKVVASTAKKTPPVVEETSGGGFRWWWLLPLLLLPLLWILCNKCEKPEPVVIDPPVVETPAPEPTPEPEPIPEPEPEPVEVGCQCPSKNLPIFNVPSTRAVSIDRLGTLPEFGNSHGLTPAQFYSKLQGRYRDSVVDRAYLDYLFRSMGYSGGFSAANASMFTAVELERGQAGLLGFGEYHGYGHYALNTNDRDRRAFLIKAANGCDVHFMKTCGNYMFFCE